MSVHIIGPDDPALAVLQQAIDDHPRLDAHLEVIPWSAYRARLMEALQAKNTSAQALFVPGHIWLPELAEAGYLAEISRLLRHLPASLLSAYDPDDIVPEVAEECRYRGRQYQLPFFSDGHLLFYREDLISFDDTGGVPIVPARELARLAQKLHHPPRHYGLALKADASEILTDLLPYLWEFGGRLLDEEGRPDFAHPANIEALEYYCALKQWCPADTEHYGNEAIALTLRKGEAALVANWGGQTAPLFLDPDNPWKDRYRTALFPHPWNAIWGIAIAANQPESDQTRTLETLMRLLSPSYDREITRVAGSPVRNSSYDPASLERYPWLAAQREMLRRARPLPSDPNLGQCLGPLYEAVHRAFNGEASAREALEAVQEHCR